MRRTGASVARSSTSTAVHRPASAATTARNAAATGFSAPSVRSLTVTGTGSRPRPSTAGGERREAADVGGHHEHVSRFERRVGDEAGVEGVAEGVELAQRAVARVHLHGAVGGAGERGGRAVLDDVALQVAQQRGRRRERRRAAAPRRPRRRGRGRGSAVSSDRTPPRAHEGMSAERVVVGVAPAGDQTSRVDAVGSAPRNPATGTRRTRRHRAPCRGRRARRAGRRRGRWYRTARRAPGPPARAARPQGRPAAGRDPRRGGARRCARARRGTARTATPSMRRAGRPGRGRHSTVPSPGTPAAHCAQHVGAVRGVLVEEVGDVAGDDVLTGSGARRGRAPTRAR